MRYLIVILVFMSFSCSRSEKCKSFMDLNGNLVLECCDDGIFRQSAICKCIKDYNKVNATNYQCD